MENFGDVGIFQDVGIQGRDKNSIKSGGTKND